MGCVAQVCSFAIAYIGFCISNLVDVNGTLRLWVWGVIDESPCVTSDTSASDTWSDEAKMTIFLSLSISSSKARVALESYWQIVGRVVCALRLWLVTGRGGRPSRVRRRNSGSWQWENDIRVLLRTCRASCDIRKFGFEPVDEHSVKLRMDGRIVCFCKYCR